MRQIREWKKHNRGNLVSWCVLVLILLWVSMTVTASSVHAEIQIPKQSDWTDHGIAITEGPPGSWDVRLSGMISPCTVVKKDGTYFLYYIGADGDRSTDGGPRHRALGVATSTDGINFTKYSENPILIHLPHNNEEEGIFSGGATLNSNGDIILYYGAMDAGSATSELVDGDIRLAVSSDGFNFTEIGDVISHSDGSVWGYGDELFPVGTFQANGQWYVYYIAKGYSGVMWDLGLAWGPSTDDLPNTQAVLTSGSYIIGGGDPVWVAPDKIALFVVRDFSTRIVEIRTASRNLPEQLSAPVEIYDFNDLKHMTIFLDTDTSRWFMYYLNEARDAIRVKTTSLGKQPPIAQDQSVTTPENTAKTITLVATDADGDPLTYSIVTQPAHGTLNGTTPNVTYTPDVNYSGSDSFTFRANDGLLDSNVADVSITVTSVNDAPVAQDQSVTTDEDTARAITLVATDVDGDTLTYSIVTQPLHGTLSGAAPNVTYTPDTDYNGSDRFTFKANDGTADSNAATVSLTVTAVNDAPVAQDQSVTTTEDTARAITLVATDVDGDTLTYSMVTQPLHGTLSGAAPNMTYTPDANYHGSDSFTFKANDGLLDSNVATVFITVGSELIISNLMVASGNAYEVVYSGLVVGALQYIDRSYTFSEVSGSITGATYIKTANNDKNRAEPDFLCFDVNQDVTIYVAHDDRIVPRPSWLHDFVDTGEDMLSDDPECSPFSLFINDFPQGTLSLGGNIDSSIPADTKRSMYTVVIVGNGSNHPPVADPNGPYTGTEGVPIAYDENGSYDPDGTIVSYLWTFGDGNNATEVNPTHIYAQDGTYTVTLTVTDNDGATNTSTTTATIADSEPTADFSASPTSGKKPLTVAFTDNSTSYDGIMTWEWDFDNDGETDSTVQNPTHVYAEEGVYTVSLTVYESDGDSDSMTKTDYMTVTKVNNPPFTPANPSPSDGVTDVPIDAVLSWTGGDPDAEDTVTYDVYFGTNTSPPQVAGNQLETTYDPGMLDYSTEYYWRIVATDNHGAFNESEVWSFTTTAVPAPETIPPLVSNPSANPDVIPDDTDNDPRWGETSQINVTVTDDSSVLSVTINLSAIGGSPIQSMTRIPDTNTWTVSTNASAGTAPGIYHLKINATDTNRNSNTSVSVELRVMKNGDIDGDGTVTLDDSEYLANYLTKIPGYGEIEEVVADVDEQVDECVTIADYEYLKNHISSEPGYEKLH